MHRLFQQALNIELSVNHVSAHWPKLWTLTALCQRTAGISDGVIWKPGASCGPALTHSLTHYTDTKWEWERARGGNANISLVPWMYTLNDGCWKRLSAAGEENSKPWVAVWAEAKGSITKPEQEMRQKLWSVACGRTLGFCLKSCCNKKLK